VSDVVHDVVAEGAVPPAMADTSTVKSTGVRKLIKQAVDLLLPTSMITWRYRTRHNALSLTFDDGPDPGYTPEVLAILRHYRATCTFFLIGERAQQHPLLVNQIATEGHQIANHSYSHPRFAELSMAQARDEIERARAAITGIGVPYSPLFRPPYGKFARQALLAAWQQRHSVVFWSVDLKDYRAANAREIYELMQAVQFTPGDVVLYHGTNAAAIDALPKVIETMAGNGARLASVGQLAGTDRLRPLQAAGSAA
jgi:peptidoglycan/xylan/chitin deacetylase (PgdA/CDA1 family)